MRNEMIILGVRADPHPQKVLSVFDSQSAIVQADACRPQFADLLET